MQKVVVWVDGNTGTVDVYDFYNEDSLELLRSDILRFADNYDAWSIFNTLAYYTEKNLTLRQAIEHFVEFHPQDDVFMVLEIQEVL